MAVAPPPSSPVPRRVKTPTWLDSRLLLGVLLVLASVLIGARVVAGADHSYRMLAVTRDLAAGTVLTDADVTPVAVRLPDHGSGLYVAGKTSVDGQQLNRAVARGELLPARALGAAPAATTLTVPFDEGAAPQLRPGQRIEVWLSSTRCPSTVLLGDATVQAVDTSGGGAFASGSGQSAVLSLPSALAQRIVTALAIDGAVIRAGTLSGAAMAGANDNLPDLAPCAASPTPS